MFYIKDQFGEVDYGESEPEQTLEDFLKVCLSCGPLHVSSYTTDLVIWENEKKVVGILRYGINKMQWIPINS